MSTHPVPDRVVGRAAPPPASLAAVPEGPTLLEVQAWAAVGRIDQALDAYRRNRSMRARDLVDALLDVRYRLAQRLPGGAQ